MKKFLLVMSMLLLLTGCESVMNNPTKRVETFLNKYQIMDEEVLKQLDDLKLTDFIFDMYEMYHQESIENAYNDIDKLINEKLKSRE